MLENALSQSKACSRGRQEHLQPPRLCLLRDVSESLNLRMDKATGVRERGKKPLQREQLSQGEG